MLHTTKLGNEQRQPDSNGGNKSTLMFLSGQHEDGED